MHAGLSRSIEYVRKNGRKIDQLRLEMLVRGNREVLSELEAIMEGFQNDDGGWGEQPYGVPVGTASCLTNTYMALRLIIEDLGLHRSPIVHRGVRYCLAHRLPGGRFDDEASLVDRHPPRWMIPGKDPVVVWKTAAVAHTLIQLPDEIRPDLRETLAYLLSLWESNRLLTGYYHASWWVMAIAARLYGPEHEAVHACSEFLIEKLPTLPIQEDYLHALEASHVAGFPLDHPLVQTCFRLLDQTQQEDGSWVNEFGPSWSVDATLRVLRLNRIYRDYLF